MSIRFPLQQLAEALERITVATWPELRVPMRYETTPAKLLLDRQVSPQAAVVWGPTSKEATWAASVCAFGLLLEVFYFLRSEAPAAAEPVIRDKAAQWLRSAVAQGNRWAGVPGMHSWHLRQPEPLDATKVWRAAGWAVARIPLEVRFDYER